MRLIRYGSRGEERPAIALSSREAIDVGDVVSDFNVDFIGSGLLETFNVDTLRSREVFDPRDFRLGPPIANTGKIVCVGLNYAAHAQESGTPIPQEPILFLKAPTCLAGPFDDVEIPPGSVATDYEVELAVVIGKSCVYLRDELAAADVIAGYTMSNDVSERTWQLDRGGQWDKGKSFPGFNPLGPLLITPDEVPDPQDLQMSLRVNGEVRQHSSTADMIFSVRHLVWYVSQCMELRPGDIINTGTPQGVGLGFSPPRYLKSDDVVELKIAGLGRQQQRFMDTTHRTAEATTPSSASREATIDRGRS